VKIYVCVKQVPDSAASIRIRGENRIHEDLTFVMNPCDEHALTEAVVISETFKGCETIAVCLGRPRARETLMSAMAMGANRSILIESETDHDSITTARALKKAIDLDGTPDLIFTGKEAMDTGGMQTMFRLAALYRMPVVTNAVDVRVDGKEVLVTSEAEQGVRCTWKMKLPCVVSAGKGLNSPGYPTLRQIMTARKKKMEIIAFGDLDLEKPMGGATLLKLEPWVEKREATWLQGASSEIADQLVTILHHRAKVI